jgi:hypothetical protein
MGSSLGSPSVTHAITMLPRVVPRLSAPPGGAAIDTSVARAARRRGEGRDRARARTRIEFHIILILIASIA